LGAGGISANGSDCSCAISESVKKKKRTDIQAFFIVFLL